MESLLRAIEVAKILNVRPSTVYDLAHRGVIPHIRIARGSRRSLIRFRHSDLERLIEATLQTSVDWCSSCRTGGNTPGKSRGTRALHKMTAG